MMMWWFGSNNDGRNDNNDYSDDDGDGGSDDDNDDDSDDGRNIWRDAGRQMSLCPKEHRRPTSAGMRSNYHLHKYHNLNVLVIVIINCWKNLLIIIIPVSIYFIYCRHHHLYHNLYNNDQHYHRHHHCRRYEVDVDANQLVHMAQHRTGQTRRQEPFLRRGQKNLWKKRRGDDKLVGPGH